MIVIIQNGPDHRPEAGRIASRAGQSVMFVADPSKAPDEAGTRLARPDDPSDFCVPWRSLVASYNSHPRGNPLGLLPAFKLYRDEIYARLVERLGAEKVFILSPAWGLIPSSFLTPDYDITFDETAEPYRRRLPADNYNDFCMLPRRSEEDLYFFGDSVYLDLFCKLTDAHQGARIVFHPAAKPPEAPGCELRPFESEGQTGWYRACAEAFLTAEASKRAEKARPTAPRSSNLEARLRALRILPNAASLSDFKGQEPGAAAIRKAIQDARSHLAGYRWLMQSLPEVDVAKDKEFQQRFAGFHRISHRSPAWHTAYFRRLETAKVIGAEFADVLDELWEETGRYEPAYASRLVATADPGKPVWDRSTLTRIGLRAPAYVDPDKLRKAGDVYRRICEWYAEYLETPGGQQIVALFDEEAPEYQDIHVLKKVEFALMPAGLRSNVLEAGRPTEVSQSQSA